MRQPSSPVAAGDDGADPVGCRSADNEQVNILKKTTAGLGSPFVAQPEPLNLLRLKGDRQALAYDQSVDMFKEADLRIQFTEQFKAWLRGRR